jgi:MIP family channel proteins
MASLPRRCAAEALGTFALVFVGAGSVLTKYFPDADYGILGIAVAHGLVLGVMVTAFMGISGGHLNPAVTLGLLATRRIALGAAAGYVLSQLVGAVAAAATLKQFYPGGVLHATGLGTPRLGASVTLTQGIAVEIILAFFLISAFYGTLINPDAPRLGGFGVGLTLLFCILIGGPLTGAAVNPARAFGPALVSGQWVAHIVWWVGPIVGGVLAALVWEYLLLKGVKREA